MYVTLTDSEAAKRYMIGQCVGGRRLFRWIAAVIDVDSGQVTAAVRDDVSALTITRFERALVAPRVGANAGDTSKSPMLLRVAEHLRASANHIAVVENQVAKPGDRWLQRDASHVEVHFGTVYQVLTAADSEQPSMARLILAGAGPAGLGILLARDSAMLDLLRSCEIIPLEGNAITRSGLEFWLEAFDGDGYLVWQAG